MLGEAFPRENALHKWDEKESVSTTNRAEIDHQARGPRRIRAREHPLHEGTDRFGPFRSNTREVDAHRTIGRSDRERVVLFLSNLCGDLRLRGGRDRNLSGTCYHHTEHRRDPHATSLVHASLFRLGSEIRHTRSHGNGRGRGHGHGHGSNERAPAIPRTAASRICGSLELSSWVSVSCELSPDFIKARMSPRRT